MNLTGTNKTFSSSVPDRDKMTAKASDHNGGKYQPSSSMSSGDYLLSDGQNLSKESTPTSTGSSANYFGQGADKKKLSIPLVGGGEDFKYQTPPPPLNIPDINVKSRISNNTTSFVNSFPNQNPTQNPTQNPAQNLSQNPHQNPNQQQPQPYYPMILSSAPSASALRPPPVLLATGTQPSMIPQPTKALSHGPSNSSTPSQIPMNYPGYSQLSNLLSPNSSQSRSPIAHPYPVHNIKSGSPPAINADSYHVNTFKVKKPRRNTHNQYSDLNKIKTSPGSTPDRPFNCNYPGCQWSFTRHSDLRRHAKSHSTPMFNCPYWKNDPTCHRNGGAFNRLDVLKRHLKLVHFVQEKSTITPGNKFPKIDSGWCRACQRMFPSTKSFIDHTVDCATTISDKWPPGSANDSSETPGGISNDNKNEKDNEYFLNDPNNNLLTLSSVVDEFDTQDRKQSDSLTKDRPLKIGTRNGS